MPWEEFEPWFKPRWHQGQHVALIGPTGTGKSTLAVCLLRMRRHTLAIDPKGGDTTLATLERKGFKRLTRWPLEKKDRERVELNNQQCGFIVGFKRPNRQQLAAHRNLIGRAIDDVFDEGGWTLYIDELQMAADRRLMNLGAGIERLLIAARDRGVSVVTAFQRPAYVPRSASEMASWLVVYGTRDAEVVDRIAEMGGRPKAEIRGVMRALPEHTVMIFSQSPYDPIILTRAPKAI